PGGTSKDYMDLKILAGDLEVARGNLEAGQSHYSDIICGEMPHDYEKSEIIARAYLQRGIARERERRHEGAKSDYAKAAQIWDELGESGFTAKAQWRLLRLATSLPTEIIGIFES